MPWVESLRVCYNQVGGWTRGKKFSSSYKRERTEIKHCPAAAEVQLGLRPSVREQGESGADGNNRQSPIYIEGLHQVPPNLHMMA